MESIPREALWQILTYLPEEDLIKLAQTNRTLRQIYLSADFWAYWLNQLGYPGSELIVGKPTQIDYPTWFRFILANNPLEDDLAKGLNLTLAQAYYRKLSETFAPIGGKKFRHPLVILIGAIRRGDYQLFLELLHQTSKKKIYQPELSRALFRAAILTDDARYVSALLEYFPKVKLSQVEIFPPFIYVSEEVKVAFLEKSSNWGFSQQYTLEGTELGQKIIRLLDGEQVHVPTKDLLVVLANLELRHLEIAADFYQQHKHRIHTPDIYVHTRLIDLFDQLEPILYEGLPIKDEMLELILPPYPNTYQSLPVSISLDPVEGPSYFFRSGQYHPDTLVHHLLELDDSWDVIIYLLRQYGDQINLDLSKVPKNKRKVVEAARQNQDIAYWDLL